MLRHVLIILLTVLGILLSSQTKVPERILKARPLSHFPDTTEIVFMGDVMMHQGQIDNALGKDGNYSFPTYFKEIESIVSRADLSVANMEFTLAGRPYAGYPCFSAPDSYAGYMADCGIDVFLTANNHILDRGASGIRRTLDFYGQMESEYGIRYTGCAVDESSDKKHNPLIIRVRGIKIAIINFTYGTNQDLTSEWPKVHRTDKEWLSSAIRKAKDKGAEFIIALPHWGVEYQLKHSSSQHSLAVWLAEEGCDAVIGSHPHVVQDMEVIRTGSGKEVPVVYSMGNIISNMSAPNTRIGMIVTLGIVTSPDGSRKLLQPETDLTWCCRPGTLTPSYCTVPVKDFLGRKELWSTAYDYDNMAETYSRVKDVTGITD